MKKIGINNVFDHLQLSDQEKIERFMALSKLYTQGGKLSYSAPFKLVTLLLWSRTVYIDKLFKICFDTTTSVLRFRIRYPGQKKIKIQDQG
jgi:hypothetical protein